MSFSVPNRWRVRTHPVLGSTDDIGNNGAFLVPGPQGRDLFVVASDGDGWEHASVSLANRPAMTPAWTEMAFVKGAFWGPEDEVIQFHPKESEYVNHHPGCLHLWRLIGAPFPTPDPWLVGPKRG